MSSFTKYEVTNLLITRLIIRPLLRYFIRTAFFQRKRLILLNGSLGDKFYYYAINKDPSAQVFCMTHTPETYRFIKRPCIKIQRMLVSSTVCISKEEVNSFDEVVLQEYLSRKPFDIHLVDEPSIKIQLCVLDIEWSDLYIHKEFYNDRFLKSKQFRILKIKKGSLDLKRHLFNEEKVFNIK